VNIFQWQAAPDGSAWWRLTNPGRVLSRLGHTVVEHRRALTSWIERADVIVAQRVVKEGPSLHWRKWTTEGKFCVFDLDDDLSCVDVSSPAAYAFFSDAENRRRLENNLARACRVVAASDRIAEWASRHNPDTVVIPNGLPAEVLSWPRPVKVAGAPVTVGWAGSAHTLVELELAAPALAEVLARYPGRVELHVVGVDPSAGSVRAALAQLGLAHPAVRVTPWADPGFAYLRAVDFDVWVSPYRDIPFNRAKFPTKALEAMFLGVPLVASAVGGYREVVEPNVTGLLVSQSYQWVRHVQRLVDDEQLRRAMGVAARRVAVGHVVEGLAPRWLEVLTP
jgi:glycosyltransferase involved in cell wall biosynthesis